MDMCEENLIKVQDPKPVGNVNHSLGLQDLYKAAFSQEFIQKEDSDETYQFYSLKQLPYPEQSSDAYQPAPALSYEVYGNDANSVLDLDKGVQVQVVKAEDYQSFTCDPQILQRYLHDASIMKQDSVNASDPSTESMIYLTKPPLYTEEEGTGILPEKIGIKYEDCDFQSSDSFASTESIIPKNIQCPKCPKKFMFKSDLTRHSKHKHTNKPKLTCNLCAKEFTSQQNLIFHEKSHKKPVANSCQICKKSFKKPASLVNHMTQKHIQYMPYTCPVCSKGFLTEPLFLTHCRTEHIPPVEKPFRCSTCGKSFEKRQGLTCHIKCHSEDQTHVCETCGKVFTKSTYMKHHCRTHANPNLQVCEICWKDFKTVNALLEHQKVHNGEKRYKCEHCGKTFTYKANFTVHLRIHSGEKPFQCEVCRKCFAAQSDLTKHTKIHRPESRLKCGTCQQEFSSRSGLSSHIKRTHTKVSTQETFTQTGDDLLTMPNVNLVVDPGLSSPQSIVLTPITSFNSLPFIISQPNGATVPFSISS